MAPSCMKITLLVFMAVFAMRAKSQTEYRPSIGSSDSEQCVCQPHVTINPPVCGRYVPVNPTTGCNSSTIEDIVSSERENTIRQVEDLQEIVSSELEDTRRKVDELQVAVSGNQENVSSELQAIKQQLEMLQSAVTSIVGLLEATTIAATTQAATTQAATTQAATTQAATTVAATTVAATTGARTTQAATTAAATTQAATTQAATTAAATTQPATTQAATIQAATTEAATTAPPTTVAATTAAATTPAATTEAANTQAAATQAVTTVAATTPAATTEVATAAVTVTFPTDCSGILARGVSMSGVYTVQPVDSGEAFRVYCDMETDGGGWTVFQRRQDGSVDFYLNFANYSLGFGDLEGEFWLGNDNLHRLTAQVEYELRVDLSDFEDETRYAVYESFSIADESDNYRLSLGIYSGTAGDSMSYHNNYQFSTKDVDNDPHSLNCAQEYHGAWWYNTGCHHSNLNGAYLRGTTTEHATGVVWSYWKGHSYSLKTSEMKVRATP